MNKSLSFILLAIGIALLAFGAIAYDSASSDFSRLFTGEPTDKAIWLLLGGGIVTLGGLAGVAGRLRGAS